MAHGPLVSLPFENGTDTHSFWKTIYYIHVYEYANLLDVLMDIP